MDRRTSYQPRRDCRYGSRCVCDCKFNHFCIRGIECDNIKCILYHCYEDIERRERLLGNAPEKRRNISIDDI